MSSKASAPNVAVAKAPPPEAAAYVAMLATAQVVYQNSWIVICIPY